MSYFHVTSRMITKKSNAFIRTWAVLYRVGQSYLYSCEYAKQSLLLYYYLLIIVLFSEVIEPHTQIFITFNEISKPFSAIFLILADIRKTVFKLTIPSLGIQLDWMLLKGGDHLIFTLYFIPSTLSPLHPSTRCWTLEPVKISCSPDQCG